MLKFVKKAIMEIMQMRQKLHQFIDSIEDKKAEAIYALLENELDADLYRKKLVLLERQKYLTGEGASHSWEDVKQMATHKEKRNGV
jgi:hypothetical protein